MMTREEAKQLGLLRYTGKPCIHGHGTERYTAQGSCVICHIAHATRNNTKRTPDTIKKYSKIYYEKHKDRLIETSHKYYESNKQQISQKKKEYNKSNREHLNKRVRDRREIDPNSRITNNIRSGLNRAIKRNQQKGATINDIGCSIDYLKEYISKKFYKDMTWENWKVLWQIDHVRSLSSFDLTDPKQYQTACHFTNLQPLLIDDHKKKTQEDIIYLRQRPIVP